MTRIIKGTCGMKRIACRNNRYKFLVLIRVGHHRAQATDADYTDRQTDRDRSRKCTRAARSKKELDVLRLLVLRRIKSILKGGLGELLLTCICI